MYMKLLNLNISCGLKEKCSILYLSSRVLDVVCSSDRRATSYTSATQSRLHRYLLLGFRLSWLVHWSCALVVLALALKIRLAWLQWITCLPTAQHTGSRPTLTSLPNQPPLYLSTATLPTTNSRSGH